MCACGELASSDPFSTADDDKSIMTEQIAALPHAQSPSSTAAVDRPAKRAPGRGRGRPGPTETRLYRKVPGHHPPREELKKKKGSHRVSEALLCV